MIFFRVKLLLPPNKFSMKRLLFLALLLAPFLSRASHVAGADIYYKHISGNLYRVSMNVYGVCAASNYSSLTTAAPNIDIVDSVNNTLWKTISLNPVPDSTLDVSPYCTKYKDSTNCVRPNSALQGYKRYVYSDTVTLPYQSAKWIFRFTSSTQSGCGGRLGRPGSVSNVVGGGTSNIVISAMVNTVAGGNSSCSFNSNLFTAYCVNVPSSYYQLARDADNDSLVFQLVNPRQDAGNCTGSSQMTYQPGYNPLSTAAGAFSFSPQSGTIIFTPNASQISSVDTKIYEYRNGVLVGYTIREKEFYVLSSCNSVPPSAAIDTTAPTFQGAIFYGNNVVACPGSTIRFRIPVSNVNNDTVTASISGIPPGSSVTIADNNTKNPLINFTWNTTGVPAGTYTFLGSYLTNGCPLRTEGLITYTIVIQPKDTVVPSIVSATHCIHKAAVQYDVRSVTYPYTLTVLQGSTVVNTVTGNSAGIVADSLTTGVYTIRVASPGVPCVSEELLTVVDSGSYPFLPDVKSPYDYCRNAVATAFEVTADPLSLPGTTFRWYDNNLAFLSTAPPVPNTTTSGTFKYYVSAYYKTCESGFDTVIVTIDQKDCNYDPVIYDAITPNGDGKNDHWVIGNIGIYPNAVVQVYDKLGDKVFEKTNYQNDWDGGNLPSGVYYYLIRLNGVNKTSGKENYTGFLLIKR